MEAQQEQQVTFELIFEEVIVTEDNGYRLKFRREFSDGALDSNCLSPEFTTKSEMTEFIDKKITHISSGRTDLSTRKKAIIKDFDKAIESATGQIDNLNEIREHFLASFKKSQSKPLAKVETTVEAETDDDGDTADFNGTQNKEKYKG